jgi:very-short-patch-repair endonuclease
MTDAEQVLWGELRHRKLGGLRFKRQVGIDRYVVDFYCPAKRLIVELDGEIHDSERQSEHDLNRDIFLRSQGLRILRIPNRDLDQDLESVLRRIQEAAERPRP